MEIYQIVVFSLLVVMALGCLANVASFPVVRRPDGRDDEADKAAPLVSVLVPARNEEGVIGNCLRSLIGQDHPNIEVLVLDDRSTDGTLDEIRKFGFAAADENPRARRRFLAGEPLPVGWAGKPWACHQLSQAARGEWLLFTDADTVHGPASVSAALATALRTRADLLSAWPRQIMETWSERLVLPLLYVLTHVLLPQALVRAVQARPASAKGIAPHLLSQLGAANGQFMLFRADRYQDLGGHEAVRAELVEDVELGRRVMARSPDGWRLVNADGSQLVRCRMYTGFRQLWEGFSKNLRPVFGSNVLAFLASGVVQWACLIQPFLFLPFDLPGRAWVVGQVALILFMRVLLTVCFRTSWWSVFFHPLAYGLALTIALNSWWWSRRGRVLWKGRSYDPLGRRP